MLHACHVISVFLLNRGDDYKNHVKCISEDQKYGGKGYEAKANKGDVKQQQWLQVQCSRASAHWCHTSACVKKDSCFSNLVFLLLQRVHEAMNKPGVSAKLKDVLRQVSLYDNVPRKKAKFQVGVWRHHVILITLCDKESFLHVLCLCRLNYF